MGLSSKELVRSLFQFGDLPRSPFIPWVCGFAAQIEQVQIEAMLTDAGLLSRALINTQKLFGYDAIVTCFDSTLEAEACGCQIDWADGEAMPRVASHPLTEGTSVADLNTADIEKRGRLPIVFDAAKRVKAIRGKDVALIGVITGPLTLARHLKGEAFLSDFNQASEESIKIIEAAGNIALKLCRAYCELGVDAIAIADELLGQVSPAYIPALSAPLKSIWNVARYYNIRSLLVSKDCRQENIEPILSLQADGVSLSGNIDYARLGDTALQRKICYAGIVPDSLLAAGAASENCLKEAPSLRGKGFFLSTEWEVPCSTDVNKMHEVMGIIRDSQRP